jgi:hypothetical protein
MPYPVSYSFPDELWVDKVSPKTMMFASHIPRNVSNSGYSYADRDEYMKVYQQSVFGITSKKCGWDCWRHLEIVSQGAAMYMLDIEQIPSKTMTHYPKQLIKQFMNKYGQYSIELIQKHANSILQDDLTTLLNESKKSLTSSAMYNYILDKSGHKDATSILFPCARRDYIFYSLQYAGKRTLGHNFVDYSVLEEDCTSFMYKDYPQEDSLKLYGRGFNYSRLLDPSLKSVIREEEIKDNIKAGMYDCIITTKNNPFIGDYLRYYDPSDIIVLCENDCNPLYHPHAGWVTTEEHHCEFQPPSGMPFFMRELGN